MGGMAIAQMLQWIHRQQVGWSVMVLTVRGLHHSRTTTLRLLGLGSCCLYYNPSLTIIYDLHPMHSSCPNRLSFP